MRVKALLQEHLDRKTSTYIAEYRLRRSDGEYAWVLARGRAIWDDSGRPLRLVGSHADITERKQAEAQLSYQAAHDALTGLPNRRNFLPMMHRVIENARPWPRAVTLCVCDIDYFKQVNDTHGHAAGDEVLMAFAGVLREGVRQEDVVGRMGGGRVLYFVCGHNGFGSGDQPGPDPRPVGKDDV